MRSPRHLLVWFCMAASLWMGAGFQLHGLSHALHALQESAAVQGQEGEPGHEPPCEQCLLFASVDGATASAGLAPARAPSSDAVQPCSGVEYRESAFTAYDSRAPPAQA